jgi:SPP1 family phage portal protein
MITYQDLLEVGDTDTARMQFVFGAINKHQNSPAYLISQTADDYDRKRNTTIMQYQKLLYTMSGQAVPDNYSANYKLCSNFFNRFVTQETQYLLGNGVSWTEESTQEKLGKDFDTALQKAGHEALVSGVAFGFWNLDHMVVFNLREFVPLYDEENGALMAGIRFWQIDRDKPMRATLYELDGYTDYIKKDGKEEILHDKRSYKLLLRSTEADGTEIYAGENYPTFPIVPLWGNTHKQSELIGLREQIDAYDLIRSGFCNDLDDFSQIFWVIQNGGGMDDIDLAKFVDRMRTVKAAVVEDGGATAESHTVEIPYASREALLDRLRSDLYDDYMALDTKAIAGGAATATQIRAAYEPLNNKADMFEYCVVDFLHGILAIAGIDDTPSFTRSFIVNTQEEIQTILSAASYLDETYITKKVLDILGDGDKAEEILAQMDADELIRGGVINGQRASGDGQAD